MQVILERKEVEQAIECFLKSKNIKFKSIEVTVGQQSTKVQIVEDDSESTNEDDKVIVKDDNKSNEDVVETDSEVEEAGTAEVNDDFTQQEDDVVQEDEETNIPNFGG